MSASNDILPAPGQRYHFSQPQSPEHAYLDRSRPRTVIQDACSRDLGIQNMDFGLGQHYGSSSLFIGFGDATSWPTQPHDAADSSPAAYLSEYASTQPSPMAMSPMPSSLHAPAPTPSPTASFASPNRRPFSPQSAMAGTHLPSPGRDTDFDTPSPSAPFEERQTKSSP